METITFTQEELKVLLAIFNNITIKLGDAVVMLPIATKIKDKIKPEPPIEKQPEIKLEDLKPKIN